MKPFTAVFEKEKDTKNAVRFQEQPDEGQPAKIGALYVQRWALNGATKVRVTVEAVEAQG